MTIPGVPCVLASTLSSDSTPCLCSALLETVGRLHPVVLHLPIGLAIAAGVVEAWRQVQGRPQLSSFTPVALWLAGASGVAACVSGLLLARANEPTDTLFWHQWLGIASTLLLLLLAYTATRATRPGCTHGAQLAPLARGLTIGLAVLVAWVGHLGGSMVWGSNFLTAPLVAVCCGSDGANAAGAAGAADGNGRGDAAGGVVIVVEGDANSTDAERLLAELPADIVFTRDVLPILEERCYSCHGRGSIKGGLALDNPDQLVGMNSEGMWIIKPEEPHESELLRRIELAAGTRGAMPPRGARLAPEQVEVIRQWIRQGASLPLDGSRGSEE